MSQPESTKYIRCHGERHYLETFDPDDLNGGVVRFETGGEQCEDCAVDLQESAEICHDKGGAVSVVCSCGTRYEVRTTSVYGRDEATEEDFGLDGY